MTIGIMIRDKFGQDIFGTTSKNLGVEYNLKENRNYEISFNLVLNIGFGKSGSFTFNSFCFFFNSLKLSFKCASKNSPKI